jgi:uncharacterized protein (TIGR02231 family)
MKKYLFLLSLLSFNLLAFDDARFPARISKVTVFQNQAQITSVVKGVSLTGNSVIIIENVSPSLDPQSIQIAGKGDLVLLGTKYNNNFNGKSSSKLRLFNDSLRTINEEIRMISYNQEALEREKDLLKSNYSTAATTIANTADKVKAMADFFRVRMADINSNIIKNERLIYNLKEKSGRIQNQINEFNEKSNQPSGEIIVSISSKTKIAFELELTYVVGGAGWSPVYDIRVKDTKSPIGLTYKANVWQQTGLDWNDVKLSLSTSNPSQGGQKPFLSPQYVNIYMPMPAAPKYQKRNNTMEDALQGRAAGVVVEPAMMEAMDATTTANYTTITENTLAVNFDIALPYTIANGGKPELVEVQSHSLNGVFNHYGLPKYDPDAFLTANISGWEQYNLLPGQANIYFEGAFIGETNILDNNVTDSLNISLGRDKKINFKREMIKDFSSKKMIGANIRESKAFRITVRNTKKEAVDLTLEDQLPLSQNADIEILDAEYKGAELNPETGKLTWKLNMKPNETKILEVKYVVKYPKGRTIIGL